MSYAYSVQMAPGLLKPEIGPAGAVSSLNFQLADDPGLSRLRARMCELRRTLGSPLGGGLMSILKFPSTQLRHQRRLHPPTFAKLSFPLITLWAGAPATNLTM